ncbi:MAG: adenylosuccinate synthase [Acidobacteriota bacterium]
MTATVVAGMQWGDEGKGKIVDVLAGDFDYVVRFNGGDNAGHAVTVNGRRIGVRLIPAGIFHPHVVKVIANGVMVNPDTLLTEAEEIDAAGLDCRNLAISDSAHIVMPWHIAADLHSRSVTMRKGIGPACADKAARQTAVRVGELLNLRRLRGRLEEIAALKEIEMRCRGREPALDLDGLAQVLKAFTGKFRRSITNTQVLLNSALHEGKRLLLEGAQGTLLDLDHGTYPHVTSTSTVSGGACTGAGIPVLSVTQVVGVVKAYMTRVSRGPFPTELPGRTGEVLRQRGTELGMTSGLIRRCGWLDMVALKYAVMLNGPTELALTKVDVLGGLDHVLVCTAYEIGGNRTDRFPGRTDELERARPVYTEFPGWEQLTKEDWAVVKRSGRLPRGLQRYVDFISNETGVPVTLLSFGPDRDHTLRMDTSVRG